MHLLRIHETYYMDYSKNASQRLTATLHLSDSTIKVEEWNQWKEKLNIYSVHWHALDRTSMWRPEGVFEDSDCFDVVRSFAAFVSARTSTLTGFLNPALASSSTASVWVAENKPVLRSLGNWDMMEVNCFWNPISKSLSASSKIKICNHKHCHKSQQHLKL